MKYLVILADGMADEPCEEIDMETPLRRARTPNMDRLAQTAMVGLVRSVPEGFSPGSDVANLSIMGYDPHRYYTGRSPLEAVSLGIKMTPQDLSLRCNLVTLSDEPDYADKVMVDYSAGEISTEEARGLIQAVDQQLGGEWMRYYPGVSYRHLLLWQQGCDHELQLTPPHDISGQPIAAYLPQGDDAQLLTAMMKRSFEFLSAHPINVRRVAQGLRPANSIWLWGAGSAPLLPAFADAYHLRGAVVAAVDLIKGIGLSAGLDVVTVEGATGGIKTNFTGKIQAALEALRQGYDYVFVHIESTDEAGHQGVLATKLWAVEQIDLALGPVITALDDFDEIRILLTPDHPTPVHRKTHTADPVPFMIFEKDAPYAPDASRRYDEAGARATGITVPVGHTLMECFISGSYRNL
jgi:2,3-bisphosphoglycerate-independent phosphoglycerate mutase